MDPSGLTTAERVTNAILQGLSAVGAPWWALGAVALVAALLFGFRLLGPVEVKPAPPPADEGGPPTSSPAPPLVPGSEPTPGYADENGPARPGHGPPPDPKREPGGGPTGGEG